MKSQFLLADLFSCLHVCSHVALSPRGTGLVRDRPAPLFSHRTPLQASLGSICGETGAAFPFVTTGSCCWTSRETKTHNGDAGRQRRGVPVMGT